MSDQDDRGLELLLTSGAQSGAAISPCGKYRYWLARAVGRSLLHVTFIMLNPSTADATQDDPTIRRCIGFARAWNCGTLSVVNLFAWRATDPRELRRVADPFGPHNAAAIRAQTSHASFIVAAWGAHHMARGWRGQLDRAGVAEWRLSCLGTNRDGSPKHPLYVRAEAQLQLYRPMPAGQGARGVGPARNSTPTGDTE